MSMKRSIPSDLFRYRINRFSSPYVRGAFTKRIQQSPCGRIVLRGIGKIFDDLPKIAGKLERGNHGVQRVTIVGINHIFKDVRSFFYELRKCGGRAQAYETL